MHGVSALIATRRRFLSPRQREFVYAVHVRARELGFSLLQRSQIAMNAVTLCEGSISQALFLSLAENNWQFEDLLMEFGDLFPKTGDCPSPKRIQKLEFALRMAQCKLRKRCNASKQETHVYDTREEEEVEEVQMSNSTHDRSPPKWSGLLRQQFLTCEKNLRSLESTGVSNGFRYPDSELRKLYVLMSLSGKVFYSVLHNLLGFPCWDTVKEYRQQLMAEVVTFEKLDGEPSNIEALKSCFPWSGDDRRCVLSIDATAVKCNFGVKIDGTVLGAVNPFSVPPETAVKMSIDQREFDLFYKQHASQIAKAAFVVIANPLSVDNHEFPVAVFAHHQGQMDDLMLGKLQKLNETMRQLGFGVVGNGFDGDAKFTKYATLLCEKMLKLVAKDMTGTVKQIFSDVVENSEIVTFFDPNHQVKCDRYRRTLPNDVCVFFNMEPSLHNRDFVELLGLSASVMSPSEIHKMDDALPKMLFNIENLVCSVSACRIDMFIALFPSTALLTAIMEEGISRRERIDLLLCAWCFMFLYYVSMLKYKPENDDSQTLKKSSDRPIALWHTDHVRRYLSSVCSIVLTLLDPRAVNLGALGSHHNENFFGQVKKMGRYDESIEGFKKAVEKTLLMRQLHRYFELSISPPGRNSMSGARIPSEVIEELPPIGYYFHCAKSLLELVTPYDGAELACAINAFQEANELPSWKSPEDALTLLPASIRSRRGQKPHKGVTLRARRQVNTSGFSCKERFISAHQATASPE